MSEQFEENGLVTCETQIVMGRERKVYALTLKGRQAFMVAVEAWQEVTR